MEFIKHMPDDYYRVSVVNTFAPMSTSTDYEVPMALRNPFVLYRLSLNHIELIEYFVRLLKPKNFLELGVQFGEASHRLLPLIPSTYVGVDIMKDTNISYLETSFPNFKFYNMTTDAYFESCTDERFDMVFIDACHTHEQTYKDFLNVKDRVSENGVIFFHDTYPVNVFMASNDLSGDCYKTAEIIRKKHHHEFEIFTVAVNPGLSMVRKCSKQVHWLP